MPAYENNAGPAACEAMMASKNATMAYSETTRAIRVSVEPEYLSDQSSPAENHFVWAYHIDIRNEGAETVQLRSRYWRITDSLGQVQEVRGAGVVGEQPVLRPGESFRYSSGTPLKAPSGIMEGFYEMHSTTGEQFQVRVPAFSLDCPHVPRRVH